MAAPALGRKYEDPLAAEKFRVESIAPHEIVTHRRCFVKFDSINPMSSVAVYMQIENLIQFAIASGELKAGDQIPPFRNVAAALDVNVNTIVKAYRDLEVMGLVYAQRGMGVYVAKGARKICRDGCYSTIVSRIHEVTQEARAAGMSKSQVSEVVRECMAVGGSPYGDVPAGVMKLAKKK
jgi:GntR family transcriptional regulator